MHPRPESGQLDRIIDARPTTPQRVEPELALFGEGRLRPVVDRGFPLADAGKALLRMERAEQFGKIVLRIA